MTLNNNQIDFLGHVVHLEDAENVTSLGVNKPFTDEELETNGLIKTSAFIRTKKSKNALKSAQYKRQKVAKGIKQLNVEVHIDDRELVKNLALIISHSGFKAHIIKFIAKHF